METQTDTALVHDVIQIALSSHEARLSKLESGEGKSAYKKITENAGALALFLGLVLTFSSLYDVLISKPKSDRIDAITKFNQAVNAAAKTRQDLVQLQLQASDPSVKIALSSTVAPQFLNNISTARALLSELRDKDIEIPQLIVLIDAALFVGDYTSAGTFAKLAVNKTDATPYLMSEANRYLGRYLFLSGHPSEGRKSYEKSVQLLIESPITAASRSYVLADWVAMELGLGDCATANATLTTFITAVHSPGVTLDIQRQLVSSLLNQVDQLQGQHCPRPEMIMKLQ